MNDMGNANDSSRRRLRVAVLLAFGAGALAAGAVWRREIRALADSAGAYVRKRAVVNNPVLIINRWSGDGKAEKYGLADEAKRLGIATVMLERGDDLVQLAHDAINSGADAIGMAGGDGSLALVASVAVERNVPFFCVPVGTRNHFALDLGLDRDNPMSALSALSDGEELAIDHGVIGDRFFLNNASFGIYAEAVHKKDYRGKKASTVASVVEDHEDNPDDRPSLRFVSSDGRQHTTSPLLMVSNNPYVFSGPPDYGRRTRLDHGVLGVGAFADLPEGTDPASAKLSDLRGPEEWRTASFRIESEDEKILAGVDGEALSFDAPLTITIKPKALRVLVPAGTGPGYLPPAQRRVAKLLDLAELTLPQIESDQ